ncbi:hypothetical protein Csa_006470, partial [Cucumis sativus]
MLNGLARDIHEGRRTGVMGVHKGVRYKKIKGSRVELDGTTTREGCSATVVWTFMRRVRQQCGSVRDIRDRRVRLGSWNN